MAYFWIFAWFGQTLLVRKMGKKSKLLIVDTFRSKPIFNDQVGPGPCAHTKFSSATKSKVSRGQKMFRKTDFQ